MNKHRTELNSVAPLETQQPIAFVLRAPVKNSGHGYRRRGRLTVLTGTLLAILIGCLLPAQNLQAQEGYRRLPPPKKKTALDSLSALHKKVKRNLFGPGDRSEANRHDYYPQEEREYRQRDYDRSYGDERGPRRSYRESQLPPQRAAHVQFEQSVDRYLDREPRYDDGSHADAQPRDREMSRDSRSAQQRHESDRELRSVGRPRYQDREDRQAIDQYSDQYGREEELPRERDQAPPHRGEHYSSHSAPDHGHAPSAAYYDDEPNPRPPQPPQNSLRDDESRQPKGADYRTGHYRNGTSVTLQQFDHQETATQRVLKLQQENQQLIDTRNTTTGENRRLMKLVQEKDRLLQEIEKAIEAARAELQNANRDNEDLKKRIAHLESEKADQLLASTRQMDSIRKQLDDVLMREITSK